MAMPPRHGRLQPFRILHPVEPLALRLTVAGAF
jgi:hypothetical protein